MYAVTKTIHFCYGHRLLNYRGKCRYLHGHNSKVEIELGSERLDSRGMVRDFSEIKQVLQTWIDRELDHKMLLARKDPALPVLRELNEPVFVMEENPTAEAIARLIFDYADSQGFPVTAVRLWETDASVATYSLDSPRSQTRRARSTARRSLKPGRAGLRLAAVRGRKTPRRVRSTSTAA